MLGSYKRHVEKNYADAAVTLTDSSMSLDVSWRYLAWASALMRVNAGRPFENCCMMNNKSACIDDDVSFCNMFVKIFVS